MYSPQLTTPLRLYLMHVQPSATNPGSVRVIWGREADSSAVSDDVVPDVLSAIPPCGETSEGMAVSDGVVPDVLSAIPPCGETSEGMAVSDGVVPDVLSAIPPCGETSEGIVSEGIVSEGGWATAVGSTSSAKGGMTR